MMFYVNSALSCSKSSTLEFQALLLFARLLQLKKKTGELTQWHLFTKL